MEETLGFGNEVAAALSANPDLDEDWDTEEVALHLARHGVSATAEIIDNDDLSVADLILSRAAAIDADLIVMGAYGRSRLREMILGGATRNILEGMKVPVRQVSKPKQLAHARLRWWILTCDYPWVGRGRLRECRSREWMGGHSCGADQME